MFLTAICTVLKNCKTYKNQYKKQKITIAIDFIVTVITQRCEHWVSDYQRCGCNQEFQFSKLNSIVSWRDLVYSVGNSCWIREK